MVVYVYMRYVIVIPQESTTENIYFQLWAIIATGPTPLPNNINIEHKYVLDSPMYFGFKQSPTYGLTE